jgi:hypothetical protein
VIRQVTDKDTEWLLHMAVVCHPPPIANVNPDETRNWIKTLLSSPNVIGLRGEHSAGFAGISSMPWDSKEVNAQLIHLFREPGGKSAIEAYTVLYALNHRVMQRGCRKFHIVSTGADLTPFARRLGAKRCGSSHVMEAA